MDFPDELGRAFNGSESVDETLRQAHTFLDKSVPLCPKVHSLANDIYREFENLVSLYGNDFLHNLMPLVVSALENLDMLYAEKQELKLDLAVAHEDQKHLLTEYEKEKNSRKNAEGKILRLEDQFEEDRKVSLSKLIQLEANLKAYEIRYKNISESLSRSEEREHELLKEIDKLRSRHNDLLRHFTIYVERTRRAYSFVQDERSTVDFGALQLSHTGVRLAHPCGTPCPLSCSERQLPFDRMGADMDSSGLAMDFERQRVLKNILETTPELRDSLLHCDQKFTESCFDELTQDDFLNENDQDIKSIDSSHCTPQQTTEDSSSLDMFSGVKREVNNLIKENQELVQTKNALNVVTTDLIGRIDNLTYENVRLTSEHTALVSHSTGMLSRIRDLEQECHRLRQELESVDMCDSICADSLHDRQSSGEDELSVEPLSVRRHFSRLEMARVLLERNYYKEQLLELQDTVLWTETLRAQRYAELSRPSQKRGSLWNWFSKLFSPSKSRTNMNKPRRSSVQNLTNNSSSGYDFRSVQPEQGDPVPLDEHGSSQITDNSRTHRSSCSNLTSDEMLKSCSHPQPTDWVCILNPSSNSSCSFSLFNYTCHFQPLADRFTGFKPWCAITVCLSDGTQSGTPEDVTDDSVHGNRAFAKVPSLKLTKLQDQSSTTAHTTDACFSGCDTIVPSLVWVCSVATGLGQSTGVVSVWDNPDHADERTAYSLITLFNMNEPFESVDSFAITSSTVMCMAAVPGASDEIQSHLTITDSYWKAIPFESSDELDDGARSSVCPDLVDSICWSTQSYPTCGHPRDSQGKPFATVQSCEWHFGTGSSRYSVERRRITSNRNKIRAGRKDGISTTDLRSHKDTEEPVSTSVVTPNSAQPTVWIGCFNGDLYIHSSVSNWRTCLHVLHLPDAVTQIRHFKGRVFVRLANGQLVVFRRRIHTSVDPQIIDSGSLDSNVNCKQHYTDLMGTWNLTEACLINCDTYPSAIRPTIVVPATNCVWSACRNRVRVIDVVSLQLVSSFEVQSNNDAHVRHMCCVDNGVWIALRRLSMLQLYHANTYEHLQTIDLEPLVIGRLVDLKIAEKPCRPIRPSSIGVTCLATTDEYLWVGTTLGLIVRFPLDSTKTQSSVNDPSNTGSCSMNDSSMTVRMADVAEMQVSRHQHAGAVRFLTVVNGISSAPNVIKRDSDGEPSQLSLNSDDAVSQKLHRLMLSGGRGYSFLGATSETKKCPPQTSGHVIVWRS